jgi:hypothetical protein
MYNIFSTVYFRGCNPSCIRTPTRGIAIFLARAGSNYFFGFPSVQCRKRILPSSCDTWMLLGTETTRRCCLSAGESGSKTALPWCGKIRHFGLFLPVFHWWLFKNGEVPMKIVVGIFLHSFHICNTNFMLFLSLFPSV